MQGNPTLCGEEPMTRTCVRVLLVEDTPAHAKLVQLSLEQATLTRFDLDHVDCLASACQVLESKDFDVILLDLGLPDGRGLEVLSPIHSQRPEIPIVVLTANSDQSTAMESVAQGAQDFLYKGNANTEVLERVLRYAVQRQQMMQELKVANDLLNSKNIRLKELYDTAYQFVDNVSHEFRTPLTVIKEFVTLTRDGLAGQVNAQQREFLDIANDRVDDLTIMVDDMLDVSKLEAGLLSVHRHETAVRDIFRHVQSALQRKAGIRKVALDVTLEDNLPAVFCDSEKIGRVLINLATNAIKFCDDDGKVELCAKADTEKSEVVFGVNDNGAGISPENLQVIFDRFHQVGGATRTSTKGCGLGLSIARQLVELNLGTIDVQSRLGEGSTFSFTVPTWNPKELVARYVQLLQKEDGPPVYATLIAAGLKPPVDPAVSNLVDEFLQYTLRSSDLVLHTQTHKWLLLTKCHDLEVDSILERIETAWTESNRNRPEGRLPQVNLTPRGTWPLETDADAFLKHCRDELQVIEDKCSATKVLVVDDDREMLRGLGIRLTAAGFDVLTAGDGQAAIDLAVLHHPDAILMDNYMPGLDGLEAMVQLAKRPETNDIPVIILSASLRDQHKALEEGMTL